ncbi:hypothetical protein FQZ97_756500 [compost metagenome]
MRATGAASAFLPTSSTPSARRCRAGGRTGRPVDRGLHARAVLQAVAAFGHHGFAGLQALGDGGEIDARFAARHRPLRGRVLGRHHVHVVAVRAVAQRRDRHHHRAAHGAQQQPQVDELVRKQGAVGVGEARLGLHGAGLRVDHVVERGKSALGQPARACAVEGGGGERGALPQPLLHLGHAVLRNGELDVDGRDLRDGGHAARAAGRDVVARVHRPQADAPAHRRRDAAPGQVELGGVFVGAVDGHGAFELLDQGGLGVDVLAGDGVLAEQRLVALQRDARRGQLGLVALAGTGGLRQRVLEGLRVDGGEHVALLDHLAFLEQHGREHARHLRLHRHVGQRRDRAQRFELHRDVGLPRDGGADGAGGRAPAACPTARPAAAGAACACTRSARAWCRRLGTLHQVPGTAPEGHEQQQGQQAPDPAAPARRRMGRRHDGWQGFGGRLGIHGRCVRRGAKRRPEGRRPRVQREISLPKFSVP